MGPRLPPEIAEAISRIDQAAYAWPEELVNDWKKVRGYCRTKHSESHRVLPAASLAAQEIAQSRNLAAQSCNHAQAALDAMAGVFGQGTADDEPDTVKHRKLPPEGGGA
jgi:hypothetical protein